MHGRQDRRIGILTLAAGLCACSASNPGTPGFVAPGDAQAKAAYLAAFKADALGEDTNAYLKDVPEHLRETHLGMMEPGEREVAKDIFRSITNVKVIGCQWSPLDNREIEPRSRPRTEGKFTAGHLCDISVHVTNEVRGPLAASTRGFFFMDGGQLAFAGEFAHGWQPDSSANRQASSHTGGSWGSSETPPPSEHLPGTR
jgi:hypothetical protein